MPNIRDALLQFYNEHYSANLMSLCLVGNYSVDTLEQFAVKHFSEVANKEFVSKDFTAGPPMYDESAFGHLVKIVPIKEHKTLTVTWPQLPST